MDYQRIFILLGLAVTSYMLILAWNEDYGSKSATETPAAVAEPTAPSAIPEVPTAPSSPAAEGVLPEVDSGLDATAERAPTDLVPEGSAAISVTTDVLELEISLTGGDITKVSLPAYPADIETPDVPFVLVDPRNRYASQSGLIGPDGLDKAAGRARYRAAVAAYTLGDEDELVVALEPVDAGPLAITKEFVFRRGDYLVDVRYRVRNPGSEPGKVAFFGQIRRDASDPVMQETNSMGLQPFVGPATRTESELYSKLDFDDLGDEPYKARLEGGYMAMVQHYFVSAWVPPADQTVSYQARQLGEVYLFGYTTGLITVAPGDETIVGGSYYVGPKDQYRLEEIATGLELTVDYGFLWWLAQPLFYLLTMIHSVVNNWGVAIILLTVVVKAILFPLSAASFKSMAKMRKLQPEMVRLKERYGEDRQQFSQAMMELYKKEGANPLGGCLPILLQMPVFLALYWTLMESVELRQAPFMLWINDLAVMDPYFILPILMGISMYLTQMLQPEPPDPMQAKVFKLMPIMFTFFFLWFPSGLVLYWLVNNILSILQQWYVTRQIDKAGSKA